MPDSTLPKPASKPAGQSKRWITLVMAACAFIVGLGSLPFVGKNKWITIAAGIASLLMAFISGAFGVVDSGTKVTFSGNGKGE